MGKNGSESKGIDALTTTKKVLATGNVQSAWCGHLLNTTLLEFWIYLTKNMSEGHDACVNVPSHGRLDTPLAGAATGSACRGSVVVTVNAISSPLTSNVCACSPRGARSCTRFIASTCLEATFEFASPGRFASEEEFMKYNEIGGIDCTFFSTLYV